MSSNTIPDLGSVFTPQTASNNGFVEIHHGRYFRAYERAGSTMTVYCLTEGHFCVCLTNSLRIVQLVLQALDRPRKA
jgi:hypothetical protein